MAVLSINLAQITGSIKMKYALNGAAGGLMGSWCDDFIFWHGTEAIKK